MRALVLSLLLATAASAQLPYTTERPGGADSDPLEMPRDLTGRSVKTARVRALHGPAWLPGSVPWLLEHDPWLAYQRGRELSLREFSRSDGAFGDAGRLGGKILDDGCTPIMSKDHINSCAACHNAPWRDMGGGINISKNSAAGRNTPHGFGGGQIEMIGAHIRSQLLAQADQNGDGWISLNEAQGPAVVEPTPGQKLSYGSFADADGNGRPDLNPIVYVWYVDAAGKRIPWARNLKMPGVAGYNLEVQVFGHGQRDRVGHGGLSSSLRAVASNAWDVHSGLQAHDPTNNRELSENGLAMLSLLGNQQFFTGFTRDAGTVRGAHGISLDDPDRDGVTEEISEGDMDLIELFQLNHPAPAQHVTPGFVAGREVFGKVGCTECHTPDWKAGRDRRFFDLEVSGWPLQGKLRKIAPGEQLTVHGVYSDFRHHDLGPAFHETQFDGSQVTKFRTGPLWGIAHSAPYGHDGASLGLEDVIERHGGEAAAVTARYHNLSPTEQAELLYFLRGLVLYSTEMLPTDVNGDGVISAHYEVAGKDTGVERFNPEWLLATPGRIEGLVRAPDGTTICSCALTNLKEAYGCLLTGLRDDNRDGFPDWVKPVARTTSAGRRPPPKPVSQRGKGRPS